MWIFVFLLSFSLQEARTDLGKSEIDTEVVEKVSIWFIWLLVSDESYGPFYNCVDIFYQVWEKIAPGLDSQFDAPYSLPLIAPRPLLLLNGKSNIFAQFLSIG